MRVARIRIIKIPRPLAFQLHLDYAKLSKMLITPPNTNQASEILDSNRSSITCPYNLKFRNPADEAVAAVAAAPHPGPERRGAFYRSRSSSAPGPSWRKRPKSTTHTHTHTSTPNRYSPWKWKPHVRRNHPPLRELDTRLKNRVFTLIGAARFLQTTNFQEYLRKSQQAMGRIMSIEFGEKRKVSRIEFIQKILQRKIARYRSGSIEMTLVFSPNGSATSLAKVSFFVFYAEKSSTCVRWKIMEKSSWWREAMA